MGGIKSKFPVKKKKSIYNTRRPNETVRFAAYLQENRYDKYWQDSIYGVGRPDDVWIKKKPDSVYAKTSPIIVKETVIWTEAKGQTLKRHGKLPAIPDNTSLYYEDKNHYSRINEIEMSDLDDEEYEYKEFHLKKKSASDVTVYDVYTRSKEGMNSTCLEYSEMVKTFRRLIVQNVRVEDVLPSLQFLENHDNIYEERNSSRKKAVEFLLHELEKSEEPGKWQKFIDALRVTGYTYIVDNIQGYKVISHEYQREYVRKLIPKIGKMITPCKVLPHLRCKGLVARCDMEEIEKVSAICSNYAGAKLLLERLLENKKYHNWYVLFIEALQEAGMNEVAMDLEIPALLPGSAQNFTDTDTVYVSENETKENQDGSKKESIQPHTFDKARDAANETHGKERDEHMKTNDSDGKIEEKTRCLEYREMVRIFKPLIVQNLLVHDILPSLPFLENHDEIYEMKNHSAKLAVQVLLDELENCQELGKWEKFISALSDNGYSYIVDNIRGYKFINHFYQREYIKSITPKIGYMIKVCEIIFFVYAKNLISESDKENIQREDANRGNFAAAVLLLDRIHRKHRNWYLLFIEALNEAGMDEVVKCLEIPALLESKRTKNSEVYKQCDGSKGEKKVTQTRRLPPPPPACPVRAGNSDEKYDYSANAHVKEEQQDTDEYTYDDTVQSTYNIPPPTNSFETENSIQSDSEYEQYELNAPPIPPRLLWSGERRDLKIQEADSAGSKQTEIIADFDNPLVKFVNPSENVRLMNENEELKKANNVLVVQISLLEQKSSMIADINEKINIRRDLLEDIALKEKENNALIAGPVESDDLETNEEANDYYPSSRTNERAEDTHADTFAPIKQTFDYRDPILYEEKCCPGIGSETYIPGHGSHFTLDLTSFVSIYDVNFYNRNKIVAMFDKDSGIGMN